LQRPSDGQQVERVRRLQRQQQRRLPFPDLQQQKSRPEQSRPDLQQQESRPEQSRPDLERGRHRSRRRGSSAACHRRKKGKAGSKTGLKIIFNIDTLQ
jgi:hypothetical protein